MTPEIYDYQGNLEKDIVEAIDLMFQLDEDKNYSLSEKDRYKFSRIRKILN